MRITNCENIILEDLTVQDSKGDLIKAMHVKGMTFRRIKAEWTNGPNEKMAGMPFILFNAKMYWLTVVLQLGLQMQGFTSDNHAISLSEIQLPDKMLPGLK